MTGHEAEELATVLQDLQRRLRQCICDFLDQKGVPAGRAAILWQLGAEAGLTVSELSRRLGQSKGYVSVLLEQMQQEGLLRKLPDPADQRLLRLSLTEPGHELRTALRREYRLFLADLLAGIPAAEVRTLTRGLRDLQEDLARRLGKR